MGFFTGVSGIARSRTNSRGKFFKDGKYLVEINKLQAFNKRDTGQHMAIVEGYIVEVLNEEQEKHEFDEGYIESIPKLGINLSGREMGDNK